MTDNVATDLSGKSVLVTGATGGIGLEAAVELARRGARLVVTGRNAGRIDAALETIWERSGSRTVEALRADFSSQAAVRRLAGAFLARHEHLDVLVNNAGSVNARRVLTEDGIETTFAVNHLAPFLLTNLLLETLLASAPARIVNVASAMHYQGTLDFDDLGYKRRYGVVRAYTRSKLANVLFTRALAVRLAGTGVTANAVHPGTVGTAIWAHGAPAWAAPVFKAAFAPVKRFYMLPPEEGAKRLVYLAASPAVADRTGRYFEKDRPVEPSTPARDDALGEKLWSESVRLTGLDSA